MHEEFQLATKAGATFARPGMGLRSKGWFWLQASLAHSPAPGMPAQRAAHMGGARGRATRMVEAAKPCAAITATIAATDTDTTATETGENVGA